MKKSNVNDGKDLLLLKYNSLQNASTDKIQIFKYLVTWGIQMLKDVVLQHEREEDTLIKLQRKNTNGIVTTKNKKMISTTNLE